MKKKLAIIIGILIVTAIIFGVIVIGINKTEKETNDKINEQIDDKNNKNNQEKSQNNKSELAWELTLANSDNKIPENYEITLENIDETRQFDSRAIEYLKNMINDMRLAGVTGVWVQSAYRSVEQQTTIYNRQFQQFKSQGKSEEEAKRLTEEVIMIPGCSDHNLGLAVDFNYADEGFEDTDAFKWLLNNAEKYGFVMRYAKEKESITKITYEPWHWRYVGEENAKKMNELDMCLEEYIEYLKRNEE